MVTVAEELPFVAVVDEKNLDTVCSNCFAVKNNLNQIDLKRCGNCKAVHYCCKACQKEDWRFHKDECQFIRNSNYRGSTVRIMSRFILRVKRGDLPVAFNGRTYDDLMDHKDEIKEDAARSDNMAKSYSNIVHFMGDENAPTLEEFSIFYGKYCINSFGIKYKGIFKSRGKLGVAVYLGLAAHNHSCRPTASYHFNGSKIVLCAKDPNAKYSKDLTVPYIPCIMARSRRQKQLRSRYYFDCDCDRCMDEETELLELSGRSDCCPTEGVVLPVHKKFLWYWQQPLVCTNCGKKADTTLEELNESNDLVAKMCAREDSILAKVHCQEDVDKLIRLLEGVELSLSPYNLLLVDFIFLVMRADLIVNKSSPLVRKCISAERKVLEKYSVATTLDQTAQTVDILVTECMESFTDPREIAFAKIDASCQKALDAVHEAYGLEDPLYKEITQFPGYNKFLYDTAADVKDKEAEEKKTAEGGDH